MTALNLPPASIHARSSARQKTLDAVSQLGESNRRLRALIEFGRETRALLETKPLLEAVARHVVTETAADGALVVLNDAGRHRLGPAFAQGMGESFPEMWLNRARQTEDGLGTELDAALSGGSVAMIRNLHEESDPRLAQTRDLAIAAGAQACAAVKLVLREEVLGVLAAYYTDPAGLNADEAAYLVAVGEEAAGAIYNARLYAQGHRELRRRDALRRVVASISSELDLESLLERVTASAVELLDATAGSITLLDADGTARMRAVYDLPRSLVGQELRLGQGITGQVLVNRAPVTVADYSHDLPGPLPGLEFLRASVAVPIWWQGVLTGGFAVFDSDPTRVFDDHDCEMMELLANHVAIAIENARLYAEQRDHLQQLVALQRLGTLLLEEHDFDRVLQAVCQQLLTLTNASGVGLALLEEHGRFLELKTVVGPSADALRGARVPVEGSFAGEALRTNLPQRSSDAQNDPRGNRQSLVIGNTKTILSVPMKTRQRAVGVISIYNKLGGPDATFSARDAELAQLFANQAAVAIENARLYEQTREYVVVEERNRLARELHDSVTQSLFSVTLLLQTALSQWDRDPVKAHERLERASDLSQGALAEMRALIFQLRPMALQEEGLVLALRKHAAAVKNREGLNVSVRVEGQERRVPAAVEEAAFRIAQESLNNVVKHAGATTVAVALSFNEDSLEVCTEDNGVGFSVNSSTRGRPRTLGMISMRERAEGVKGTLRVESTPGQGTRVTAVLPIPPADA